MTVATCKCVKGHTFSTTLVADDPDTNCCEVDAGACPVCGAEEFEIIETYDDWED